MDVIILPNGERVVIGEFRDLTDLIDKYIGEDAVKWLREYISDLKAIMYEEADLNATVEIEKSAEYYQNVIRDINEMTEDLAREIQKPKLDRKAISRITGKICEKAYRNL